MEWEQLINIIESCRDNGWKLINVDIARPAIEDIPNEGEYVRYKSGNEVFINIVATNKE